MSRGQPPTPPGTHGRINYRTLNSGRILARTRLRLYDGRTIQVGAVGNSKTAATRELEKKCVTELGTPYADTITPVTKLSELIETWFAQHDVSVTSKKTYRSHIDNKIIPGIGELRLGELTPPVLQGFISRQSPGAAKTCAAIISAALKYAVRVGGIPSSPWQAIRLPKPANKPVVNVTQEQQTAYIAAVERWCTGLDPDQADDDTPRGRERGHGLPQLVRLIAGSGVRTGEALALRVNDVDVENRRITINGQVNNHGGRTDRLKNKSSQFARRTITVTEDAANAIVEQLNSHAVKLYTGPLFPTFKGTYKTVNNINRDLRDATKGMDFGVPITPKAFRSTIASRIAAKYGHDAAQRQLGHSNSDVTEKYYTAPPPMIDDYLGGLD